MGDRDGLEALRHRGESLFELAIDRLERIRSNGQPALADTPTERVGGGLRELQRAVRTEAGLAAREARS